MASWTDYFLIPFKVSLDKTRATFQISSKLCEEGEMLEQSEKSKEIEKDLYAESMELRGSLLASVEGALGTFTIPQKYLMIFGEKINQDINNIKEADDLIKRIADLRKIDDIVVDTLDKMIIDDIIEHLQSEIDYMINVK